MAMTPARLVAPGYAFTRGESRAARLLREAREHERSGNMRQAAQAYASAAEVADETGELAPLAEALRRLAVVHMVRRETARARELCRRSFDVATALGDDVLAAEALNAAASFDLESGNCAAAR